tara:strand:- start:154 stop:465 length:312 start_codon:yes stop_codon:yes gene_type:complete
MPLPLPIIAAGVAARYGAKKLAKALVKRNTKKANVKAKKLDQQKNAHQNFMEKHDNMIDSVDNPYGTIEYTNIPKPYVSPKLAKNLKRQMANQKKIWQQLLNK